MRNQACALAATALFAMTACQDAGEATPGRNEHSLDALYARYTALRGDLHLHSSTASFDSRECGAGCRTFTAAEQLAAARDAGLDFAALTEHDRDPNDPGVRMSDGEWKAALQAVGQANSEEFVALAGYEWTSSHRSCFETNPQRPDFGHKVVILPPNAPERCDSDVCTTPDQLGEFVHTAGGLIFTPHPWRVVLLEASAGGLPAFFTRNYFDYEGDGPGGVFVGAEVGPDFQPLRWKLLCARPEDDINSQTGTLAEWREALAQGKRLAAIATSDRHFGFTPLGSRTTIVFADGKTPAAIIEALRARRTMAANLAPFDIRLSIGNAILGETAQDASEGKLRVAARPEDVVGIEVWSGEQLLVSFAPGAVDQELRFTLDRGSSGPIWAKVSSAETDPVTGTARTTITSPIWLE